MTRKAALATPDTAAAARVSGPVPLVAGALAAVALLSGVAGFAIGRAGPTPFEAKVVAFSTDGDSLCVDRVEDSCGQPVLRPEDRERIEPGLVVEVREMWVGDGDRRRLVFFVEVPG